MPGFLSRMYLLPEENWGFFVSYTCWDLGFKEDLTTLILDRYCPFNRDFSYLNPFAGAHKDLQKFTGYYRQVEGLTPTLLKLKYLDDLLPVSAADRSLRIFDDNFVEVEPLFFRSPKNGGRVAFRVDDSGDVQYLFVGSGAFEKVRWNETPAVQYGTLIFFSLVFLSFLIVWPIRLLGLSGRAIQISLPHRESTPQPP